MGTSCLANFLVAWNHQRSNVPTINATCSGGCLLFRFARCHDVSSASIRAKSLNSKFCDHVEPNRYQYPAIPPTQPHGDIRLWQPREWRRQRE